MAVEVGVDRVHHLLGGEVVLVLGEFAICLVYVFANIRVILDELREREKEAAAFHVGPVDAAGIVDRTVLAVLRLRDGGVLGHISYRRQR